MPISHCNSKIFKWTSQLLEEGILSKVILICGIIISNVRIVLTVNGAGPGGSCL